ncbi:NAD(P)-dependent oxidoreductase [Paenibacillus tritici]|uniref:NAD(P)-dependent oxidoreductase n=1 Tax=Paenibacillus tritici TaxID=1873425 RepID=A0ABX2E079_9BACL|nr:NAD(P)-dependent oxidoreductase [Paenibacillus tritici]NQX49289.1 NAD(P)-dependent oxidoreductase [Paenibacillus tritici]
MNTTHYDRIFITGYSSFIGSHVFSLLRDSGMDGQVILLGRKPQVRTSASWQYLDLTEPQPAGLPYSGRNLLIHYAAQLPGSTSVDYKKLFNSEADFLERCRIMQITDVVYASTGGVYGYSGSRRESDIPHPEDPYSAYKFAIEENIACLWPRSHLILRYFFPFGGGQRIPRLIPGLIHKLMGDETIRIAGERHGLVLNPVYIADAAEASVWLIRNNLHGIYNIAGRHSLTLLELVQQLSSGLNRTLKLEYSDEQDREMTGSVDKLLSMHSGLLSTPWNEAIRRTVIYHVDPSASLSEGAVRDEAMEK